MSDLIDKKKVLSLPRLTHKTLSGEIVAEYINVADIEALPSAEPERKTGRWINAYPDIEPNPMFMYGICSECGFEQSISDKLNYCPSCGAKMEGKE